MKKYLQEVQTVNFYGAPIFTGRENDDSPVVVPLKTIIEDHLGLKWDIQREKVNASPLYNPVNVLGSSFENDSFSSRQTYLCIPLTELNLLLAQINVLKVPADRRDNLIRYQKECMLFLHDVWMHGAAVNNYNVSSDILSGISEDSPRKHSTLRLARMCDSYASRTTGVSPDDIHLYVQNEVCALLDVDAEEWTQSFGMLEFMIAFMERAASEILRMAIEGEVDPSELPEIIQRNLQSCWTHSEGCILSVKSPYAPIPGMTEGAKSELV